MVNILSNSGKIHYGVQQFVLDTPDDLVDLGTHHTVGSTAFIISTSQKYMLNSQEQWVPVSFGSSGGGGGSEDDGVNPDDTYIYDGGLII